MQSPIQRAINNRVRNLAQSLDQPVEKLTLVSPDGIKADLPDKIHTGFEAGDSCSYNFV